MPQVSGLVICTLARPQAVRHAVRSALVQSSPPKIIVIVDGSGDPAISVALATIAKSSNSITSIVVLASKSGLPRQRNAGMDHVLRKAPNCDYIHFIDDDVTLNPGYIAAIEEVFRDYSDAIVVGGRDLNRSAKVHPILGRISMFDSRREGCILKSAFNIMCESPNVVTKVEWLSGLSQSYRVSKVTNLRFDESIRFYGEEVDMHIRCGFVGALYWTPHATLRHESSSIGRESMEKATFETDQFKWNLCKRYPLKFNRFAFLYATCMHAFAKYSQGALRRDSTSMAVASGHVQFLRNLLKLRRAWSSMAQRAG